MAVDRRQGTKVPKWAKQEETPGARIDPGPYIGIVKNNIDPARAGRLQVWIPDLGGDPNLQESWRTVNYASPYMGQTFYDPSPSTTERLDNDFASVPHSYGFWMVPPDINVQVLVTFVAGDPYRGYWFACLPPEYSHHMIPAMGSSTNVQFDTYVDNGRGGQDTVAMGNVDDEIAMSVTKPATGNGYPIAEFNLNSLATPDEVVDLYDVDKPIHTEQFKILREQGLIKDSVRGVHTSSSQRESPSNVFGLSTPGRPIATAETTPKGGSDQIPPENYAVTSRKGGHIFVLDDGDSAGNNQLVKLRSAGGHQILLNDSNDVIYIVNSLGNGWIELTGDGQINIFSDSGFNFRTQGTINLHADLDINMNAKRKINMRAEQGFQLDAASMKFKTDGSYLVGAKKIAMKSESAINLTAGSIGSFGAGSQLIFSGSCIGLNSAAAPDAEQPTALATNNLNDTTKDGTTKLWKINPGTLNSVVTIAPTHEPFERTPGRTTNVDMSTGRFPQGNTSEDVVVPPTVPDGDLVEIVIAFLRKEEGFPRGGYAYPDPPGQTSTYSIGYGHQIKSDEYRSGINCGAGGTVTVLSPVTTTIMTRDQAEALLRIDLTKSGGYIDRAKGPIGSSWNELTKYQQAALVSYAYNTGSTNSLVRAGIVTLLNRDQTAEAGELISTKGIATAGGQPFPPLVRRRRAETALWNTA